MKKVISFLFLSIVYFGATAQAPDSLSFQAVIRAEDGTLLADQSVSARVGIYQGAEDGTLIFEETHTATTNSNGLLTLLIGGGSNVTGDLSTIDWGAGPYFIKREIDPNGGTDYVISGTSQFLSVPYALYAASGGSADNMGNHTASQDLDMNGNAITEKSSASTPLTLEVKLNDQDMQLTSYDEIYITTIEGTGNDPDGNPYSTFGDIELTSADDIFINANDGLELLGDYDVIISNDIDYEDHWELGDDDDVNIYSSDDVNIISSDNVIIEPMDNFEITAGANVNITSGVQLYLKSGAGENLGIETGNDIELIANDDDLDFVEIWRGRYHALYNLPNTEGEEGQILIREGTATGATSERYTQWTPYKLPLTDGTNGQTLITDGGGNVTWGSPPAARISNNTLQNLSNYEELDSKTQELNTLLKESMSKIEELEKRLNEQQELINRQFELIKKLEEKK